tara:strand:- start:4505 stop:4891 length:387 start_codon:yes stop_codon:yes gene_type:complete
MSKTIASILQENKVSPKQIVRACNVTHASACSWIRGANVPNPKSLKPLSEIAGVKFSSMVHARKLSLRMRNRKAKTVLTKTNSVQLKNESRRKYLMEIASEYSTLTSDEKVVVGMLADAFALLGGKSE